MHESLYLGYANSSGSGLTWHEKRENTAGGGPGLSVSQKKPMRPQHVVHDLTAGYYIL